MYKQICKQIFNFRFGATAVMFTQNEVLSRQKISDKESTRKIEMESSIQRAVERAFFTSQKLIIDETARVVEERLTKRSRGITDDVLQES